MFNDYAHKVTTLIPTYRRPDYLRRTILSVLRQTYGNLQVSVFDDASDDNTDEVVSSLSANDTRIKYHRHANNIGCSANYKYAVNSVDTPYFSIISDDDFLARDFYENAVNVLDSHPKVMFVILNTLVVDEYGNLVGNRMSTNRLSFYCDQDRFDVLHSGNVSTNWTAMVFRKEVAQIYADMDDRYDVAFDMRFLFHAAARYNFAYLSKVGAFFTFHPGSFSVSRNRIDLVHRGVHFSRYVEIFYDENIPQYIRDRAAFYLIRSMLNNPYKSILIGALRRFIKRCCTGAESDINLVNADIRNLRYSGYVNTSVILNFIHKNKFIRNIVGALFYHYYNKLTIRRQAEMSALQNGIYKGLFEDIKEISSCISFVDSADLLPVGPSVLTTTTKKPCALQDD